MLQIICLMCRYNVIVLKKYVNHWLILLIHNTVTYQDAELKINDPITMARPWALIQVCSTPIKILKYIILIMLFSTKMANIIMYCNIGDKLQLFAPNHHLYQRRIWTVVKGDGYITTKLRHGQR